MASADSSVLTKHRLRRQLLEARARRSEQNLGAAAAEITGRVLDLPEIATAGTVAGYVSTAAEPGTRALLDELHHRGVLVLLPRLLDNGDLEWGGYEPGRLREGSFAILEPAGEDLGPGAITDADVVICPGVAGTPAGDRLGRGGGSFDRALARTRPRALRALLLYDDEVVDAVPIEPHDEPVDAIITESQVLRTARRRAVTSESTSRNARY